MDRSSMQKLRLDRRLIGRRDWISPQQVEKELAELPDTSHKAVPSEERAPADPSSPAPRDSKASEAPGQA